MTRTRIGAIGAGGFGLFALQQFLQVEGAELVAIAGTHREAAIAMARRFGVTEPLDVETLLQMEEVDLVYIATPPFLHYSQVRAALEAGKHVICEKPLALTVEQADDLLQLARAGDQLCIANLMQRYNPLYEAVHRLIESRVLGEFLHGWFDNAAGDEGLSPEHWFWDRARSGGIFIEHGVHFFDLFEGWLGQGEVVAAQRILRPGSGVEEQVQCVVRYGNGALVTFYHGFTQPARLERQEFRLLFERGELTLDEWVPIRVRLKAVVDEAQTRTLMEIFPDAQLDVLNSYSGPDRLALGRHKDFDVYQKIDLRAGLHAEKMRRYCELLRALFADQLAWLADRSHPRLITEANGLQSLAMACAATELADSSP
ncbi:MULTISPECIES: Gfo/Idh/MocA family protein [unclassified Synechococcus]|uniref:Gfo/Idh/MocA family protein n=1 Tax=unclassified Synechococcus TaxID=2626047 RepID=UPI0021A6977E|nr:MULTISPECIES: Gfo/Idh/MocA family oxidoreductase [unclassified Synechococcus]MCT0213501.1 Gfo/Idh/MocA family oxidoreductase [Synechococcus sp. CS-1326]MCT0234658.1 Gfo/Idh/MocA family oxidoreductase [Synechococcus sp. CS-1327]